MNNLKRWFLILTSSGLIVLLLVGILIVMPAFAQGPGGMMGRGMMGQFGYNNTQPGGYGPGWMRGGHGGMMGGYGPRWGYTQDDDDPEFYGYGYGCDMGRGGMMWGSNSPFFTTEPLTLAEATEAVNTYLANLGDDKPELGEVMVFDNHAYAQIIEKEIGIGAMEVLVDPSTKAIYPEMGPNMMWNLKYGMMAGFGGYGMMGRFGYNTLPGRTTPNEASAEMPVTPGEAVEAAQAYLDTYVGDNLTADEHADPFYGYYTLHVNRDGETIGMLSVNGYTRQVFLHTWHGNLLEMSGEDSH